MHEKTFSAFVFIASIITEAEAGLPEGDKNLNGKRQTSDESDDYSSMSGQCTLMELLKEEFERTEKAKLRREAREKAHPTGTVLGSTVSLGAVQVSLCIFHFWHILALKVKI